MESRPRWRTTTMIGSHRLGGTAPNRSPSQVTPPAPTLTSTHTTSGNGSTGDRVLHEHRCLWDAASQSSHGKTARKLSPAKIPSNSLGRSGFGQTRRPSFNSAANISNTERRLPCVFEESAEKVLCVVFFQSEQRRQVVLNTAET